jgi:hypothetical protein
LRKAYKINDESIHVTNMSGPISDELREACPKLVLPVYHNREPDRFEDRVDRGFRVVYDLEGGSSTYPVECSFLKELSSGLSSPCQRKRDLIPTCPLRDLEQTE